MPRFSLIYLFLIWPFLLCSIIMEMTGVVCTSYQGFAVDNNHNIYLGKNRDIEVLNDQGIYINKIHPMTSRGYRFTLVDDSEIWISTGDHFYKKDLSDHMIEEKPISLHTDDPLIGINFFTSRKFTASNGTEYRMKLHFLRTHIYRYDGEKQISVYTMPVLDFIVRMIKIWIFLTFPVVFLIGIIKSRQSYEKEKQAKLVQKLCEH